RRCGLDNLLITLSALRRRASGSTTKPARIVTRGFALTMARFRLELGPVPLHHQVYLDLRAALDAGEWRPGDLLPPERQLAARYGCSLITVRRALSELTYEGRLERRRGHGTTVLRPRIERDFGGTMSFAEEMQDRGLDPETRLVAARPESAGEQVAAALPIHAGPPTPSLRRPRAARGQPPPL